MLPVQQNVAEMHREPNAGQYNQRDTEQEPQTQSFGNYCPIKRAKRPFCLVTKCILKCAAVMKLYIGNYVPIKRPLSPDDT